MPYFCYLEYPGHAENFIRNLPKASLLRYRAIVTCSGDGLVYEVINGFISRKNYDDAIDEDTIPVGILPGGSANSTAASICYHSGLLGKSSLLSHCGFLLTLPIENLQNSQSKQVNEQSENYNFTLPLLPCISPMSGIHFGTCDRNFHRYGIQSIEWGFVADLDYKSERFRWMGEKRFLLYACYYLMKKPTYRAKLSYLPFDNVLYQKNKYKNDELVQKSSVPSTQQLAEMKKRYQSNLNESLNEDREIKCSFINDYNIVIDQFLVGVCATYVDCLDMDLSHKLFKQRWIVTTIGTQFDSRFVLFGIRQLHPVDESETGQNAPEPGNIPAQALKSDIEACGNSSDFTDKLNVSPTQIKKSCQSWSFLPETNQPISNHQDKWVTLDKNFVTILVTNHSHITSSTVMYPDAHISDPYLTLLILHENTTRLDLLALGRAMSNGQGLQSTSNMDIVKICALRIEPYSKDSVITMLDGELMPSGTFQAEVIPGILNVISGTKVV
ncbi:unnamed protein product [Schistosoma mattheei]|uniref:DAGKc domain-containing protein n=2 Tax=Schistosoma mattheei TaxID=31246 RepID=A0A183PBL4_9TREM|nr:unnamed protein product [Schistosoma mattheei]